MAAQQQTVVLEVAGVYWASEKAVAEAVLGRRPGVLQVEAVSGSKRGIRSRTSRRSFLTHYRFRGLLNNPYEKESREKPQ
jgi:hypothetical protein